MRLQALGYRHLYIAGDFFLVRGRRIWFNVILKGTTKRVGTRLGIDRHPDFILYREFYTGIIRPFPDVFRFLRFRGVGHHSLRLSPGHINTHIPAGMAYIGQSYGMKTIFRRGKGNGYHKFFSRRDRVRQLPFKLHRCRIRQLALTRRAAQNSQQTGNQENRRHPSAQLGQLVLRSRAALSVKVYAGLLFYP
jgi:hypothetical protein